MSFNYDDQIIFTGTNRGIINVWDLEKMSSTHLGGHTTSVSAMNIFENDGLKNLLITGSLDTNIKVWDIRNKNMVNMFKGHTN